MLILNEFDIILNITDAVLIANDGSGNMTPVLVDVGRKAAMLVGKCFFQHHMKYILDWQKCDLKLEQTWQITLKK